jgi:hypothetical protein
MILTDAKTSLVRGFGEKLNDSKGDHSASAVFPKLLPLQTHTRYAMKYKVVCCIFCLQIIQNHFTYSFGTAKLVSYMRPVSLLVIEYQR